MSYKVYAGVQTGVDTWKTKVCIHDISDITDTKKLISPTLTREVREHNNFARRVPILEEQMKVVNHRIADLEADEHERERN